MTITDITQLLVPIFGSGSFLGGLYLLWKVKAETGSIVVKSAEGVVVLQSTLIDEFRAENLAQKAIVIRLQSENVEQAKLITTMKQEIDKLKNEIVDCNEHICKLEAR